MANQKNWNSGIGNFWTECPENLTGSGCGYVQLTITQMRVSNMNL